MAIVLSIAIITYNQSKFIRQCIDSVLAQKVNFDYEIVIGDDGSTDSTATILSEYITRYPETITVITGENAGISENYKRVLSLCSGEYIAFLEGDDYWTDVSKLQTQVDFLRTHKEYGFVGCYNQVLLSDGKIMEESYSTLFQPQIEGDWEIYGDVFEFAKFGPVTRTATLCFRKSIIEPYIHLSGLGNDMVIQTVLAKFSKFAKRKRSMAIYRQGGVSTTYNLDKQLYYNNWFVNNRLLQKRLFPDDCNWDEDELLDREEYILLKEAIHNREWYQGLAIKKRIRSDLYKHKAYYSFFLGPITGFFLSLVIHNYRKG